MQNLMNKVAQYETELLHEIEKADIKNIKEAKHAFMLIEMYNELCEFKKNVAAHPLMAGMKQGNPYP